MKDLLDELPDLIENLKIRNLYHRMRDFLSSIDLNPGRGWGGIRKAIEQVAQTSEWASIANDLQNYLRDAVLVGQKRVYILNKTIDPSKLAPPIPAGFRCDYLAASSPPRTDKLASYLMESRTIGDSQITTFVTFRHVRRTEDVQSEMLNDAGLELLQRADIVAKFNVKLRCYDHLIRHKEKCFLLIDCPEGVDSGMLGRDETNYSLEVRKAHGSTDAVFLDLFDAVESIYRDDKEGIVNFVEFISNNRASVAGDYERSSDNDYRKHPFQVAGETSGAQVIPYRLRIKWLTGPSKPVVVLPGRSNMISGSAGSEGRNRPPLNYMTTDETTTWEGFVFATDRVLKHLAPK